MALAITMEGLLARGEVKTQIELARLMCMTPARVTQIMRLLDLAPGIQEVLLTTSRAGPPITERRGVAVAGVTDWRRQQKP
jgi:hypothetical protein